MASVNFATVLTTARTVAYGNVLAFGDVGEGLRLGTVLIQIEDYVIGPQMRPIPVTGNVVVAGRSSLTVAPVVTDETE